MRIVTNYYEIDTDTGYVKFIFANGIIYVSYEFKDDEFVPDKCELHDPGNEIIGDLGGCYEYKRGIDMEYIVFTNKAKELVSKRFREDK